MGRRSLHTPEQLRELILSATQRLVESGGVGELSAREIARAIGYAPGTLYNMFANLDDILLHVEARFLGEIERSIVQAMKGRKGTDALQRFAAAYVSIAYRQSHLWHLLQVHHPAGRRSGPDWYMEKVYAPLAHIEMVLAKIPRNRDVDEISRTAKLLWCAVHGVVLVASTAKYGAMPLSTTIAMVESLVECHVAGFSNSRGALDDMRIDREPPRQHLE